MLSSDSSVTGLGGDEILCNALETLSLSVERNTILYGQTGQEASDTDVWWWHMQVDAWKCMEQFRRKPHQNNRRFVEWHQKYCPELYPFVAFQLMQMAANWNLSHLTEIDFIVKPFGREKEVSVFSQDFATPFIQYNADGRFQSFMTCKDFLQHFRQHTFLVESTLANQDSPVDKTAKLNALHRLAQLRGQGEHVAFFFNGSEGSPPARMIPENTLVFYFAQQVTLTFPARL